MTVRIVAEPCRGKDLQPGDLFSTYGPGFWNHFDKRGLIDRRGIVGEKVYIRTSTPADSASDGDTVVYRITIVKEDQEPPKKYRVRMAVNDHVTIQGPYEKFDTAEKLRQSLQESSAALGTGGMRVRIVVQAMLKDNVWIPVTEPL